MNPTPFLKVVAIIVVIAVLSFLATLTVLPRSVADREVLILNSTDSTALVWFWHNNPDDKLWTVTIGSREKSYLSVPELRSEESEFAFLRKSGFGCTFENAQNAIVQEIGGHLAQRKGNLDGFVVVLDSDTIRIIGTAKGAARKEITLTPSAKRFVVRSL